MMGTTHLPGPALHRSISRLSRRWTALLCTDRIGRGRPPEGRGRPPEGRGVPQIVRRAHEYSTGSAVGQWVRVVAMQRDAMQWNVVPGPAVSPCRAEAIPRTCNGYAHVQRWLPDCRTGTAVSLSRSFASQNPPLPLPLPGSWAWRYPSWRKTCSGEILGTTRSLGSIIAPMPP